MVNSDCRLFRILILVAGLFIVTSGLLGNLWAAGPLRVHPKNPRYFTDDGNRVIYLTGSHTWCNFQDCGDSDPPPVFDYTAYLDFLQEHNHNFIRLWRAENSKGGEAGEDFWFDPMPYQRPGPGLALDGKPKFDLNQFNQEYFDRLRARVVEAGRRDIYVSIMLFDGWSVETKTRNHNPWPGHPFNRNNNINGIDGDVNGDEQGGETHTLENSSVLSLQEAYVRKVIETVADLDNVLYEISNESSVDSLEWQYHMIDFIKNYEAGQPKRHPVGMTIPWPGGDNADLFSSPADWISPNGDVNDPAPADGSKVVVCDTDHFCGICGDPEWVWKSFTRGCNPIFMDPYDKTFTGRGAPEDYDRSNANDRGIRESMGHTLSLSRRIDLAEMNPCTNSRRSKWRVFLSRSLWKFGLPGTKVGSSEYCLTNIRKNMEEYIIYFPEGGDVRVDLSKVFGNVNVEWFNVYNGTTRPDFQVLGGGIRTLRSPFGPTNTVLYLYR